MNSLPCQIVGYVTDEFPPVSDIVGFMYFTDEFFSVSDIVGYFTDEFSQEQIVGSCQSPLATLLMKFKI